MEIFDLFLKIYFLGRLYILSKYCSITFGFNLQLYFSKLFDEIVETTWNYELAQCDVNI